MMSKMTVAGLLVFALVTDARGASILSDATVRFETGRSTLTAASQKKLGELAKKLKAQPELTPVLLVGHADDRGDREGNLELSKRRAFEVKTALLARGIAADRVQVRGAGSSEPLTKESSEEARALNRRVEVWVTPKGPVAKVTTVKRKVMQKAPAKVDWAPARVGLPLRKQSSVRTMKRSASEVTFRSRARVTMGPEALVVIYGTHAQTEAKLEAKRKRVSDVKVEAGSIFARLAARSLPALDVATESSEVKVSSKKTRIDVRRRKRSATTTVSVFDGSSKVKAKGTSVEVKAGYGTRVEPGKPPEPPRALPPPPRWKTRGPIVVPAQAPLDLRWALPPGVNEVEVQIGGHDDPTVERPVRLWKIKGDTADETKTQAGYHHVRLASVDDRGITGAPSKPLRLVALPTPLNEKGEPLVIKDGLVNMPGPGLLRLPKLEGAKLSLNETLLLRPGLHELPLTISKDKTNPINTWLKVQVATATVVVHAQPAMIKDGSFEVEADVEILGRGGMPIEGLQLHADQVALKTEYLVSASRKDGAQIGDFKACVCKIVKGVALREEQPGRYRLRYQGAAAKKASVVLRVRDVRAPVGFEFQVALVKPTQPKETKAQSGLLLGLRLGGAYTELPSDGSGGLLVGAEAGGRLHLIGPLALDLGLDLSWSRRTIQDEAANIFPLLGRAALVVRVGRFRFYGGAGLGLRFTDGRASTAALAWGVPIGFGVRLGLAEVVLEGVFMNLSSMIENESMTVWAATLGYRVLPWGQW